MRSLVLGFLTGITYLQTLAALPQGAPLLVFLLALVAAAALLWVRSRSPQRVPALVLFALVFCGVAAGFSYATWRAETRLSDQLAPDWEGRDVDIVGVVASLPGVSPRGTRFEFDVEKTLTENAHVPAHIALTWYPERKGESETPVLIPGERWHLTVRLRRPHGTMNPHGFDYEAWALERNVRAGGYVRTKGTTQKLNDQVPGMFYRVDRLRQKIQTRMKTVLGDAPQAGVLIALAIGEQNAINQDGWRVFWRTGVGHLMSISGLHVTMIASLFYWIAFRLWGRVPALALRLPAQRAATLVGALTALSYALIAGFSVPTQRTVFMLGAVAIALWLGRTTSGTRILAWALLAVLLFDPWAVLAPGCWLSFGAVAAIFFVSANRIGQVSSLKGAALTQLAVTLGLLPMTLALFQEVSVISPIANAFAIPIVSLVVVPITLLGAVLPIDFLLHLAHQIMAWCYWALDFLSTTPNAVWQSHAPSKVAVALALMGVALLLMPRGMGLRLVGAVVMLPLFLHVPATPKEGELWVTLLDVGQGLAAVVRTATHTLVYDTGPVFSPESDAGSRIIVPYLRGEGLTKLDALIVTHDDEDHTGGVRSIISARNPSWVMTSISPTREILRGAREVVSCDTRDTWHWDGVDFAILHPMAEDYNDPKRKNNNMGCTLKITAPGGTLLLTADIEKRSEAELTARDSEALKADVMTVPHHGSKTSSTDEFLDAVAPTLALMPVGYRNRFKHPHDDVVARYAARGIAVMRTDERGALRLKFSVDSQGKPAVSGYRGERQRYWLNLDGAGGSQE